MLKSLRFHYRWKTLSTQFRSKVIKTNGKFTEEHDNNGMFGYKLYKTCMPRHVRHMQKWYIHNDVYDISCSFPGLFSVHDTWPTWILRRAWLLLKAKLECRLSNAQLDKLVEHWMPVLQTWVQFPTLNFKKNLIPVTCKVRVMIRFNVKVVYSFQ